jgi:hypothetical protein
VRVNQIATQSEFGDASLNHLARCVEVEFGFVFFHYQRKPVRTFKQVKQKIQAAAQRATRPRPRYAARQRTRMGDGVRREDVRVNLRN